jgi:hypothetical protein
MQKQDTEQDPVATSASSIVPVTPATPIDMTEFEHPKQDKEVTVSLHYQSDSCYIYIVCCGLYL